LFKVNASTRYNYKHKFGIFLNEELYQNRETNKEFPFFSPRDYEGEKIGSIKKLFWLKKVLIFFLFPLGKVNWKVPFAYFLIAY